MRSFETPDPISVTIELRVGDVQLVPSERPDTVVEVRPTSESDQSDVEAAEQTRVELSGDRLSVVAPRLGLLARLVRSASVDVVISLPAGSSVQATLGLGDVRSSGPLGDCRILTGAGQVMLADTGALQARTGSGDVIARRVVGDAEVETGSGATRLEEVTGSAAVKTGAGSPQLGPVGGDLRVRAGNGDIVVAAVGGSVDARTAHGRVRIGRVSSGDVEVKTAHGGVDVGVADGTRAWVDLETSFGRVTNELTSAALSGAGPAEPGPTGAGPTGAGPTVRLTARTSFGDIRVLRVTDDLPEATP
jgi:DUF4097 and DUF4098 domain-containing protein YvlB